MAQGVDFVGGGESDLRASTNTNTQPSVGKSGNDAVDFVVKDDYMNNGLGSTIPSGDSVPRGDVLETPCEY